MANHKETTGSKSTMRRTLMGGAIVSTLLLASLAPASAGCLGGQVRINATIVDYSNTQTSQLGVNWAGATGSQNSGSRLGWAPADDFRLRARYGSGNRERPEPQANRGGRATFGGVRIGGNQTVQWGQGRTIVLPRLNPTNQINVSRQSTPILRQVPAFNFHRDQSANTRISRGDLIVYVSPRIIRDNER